MLRLSRYVVTSDCLVAADASSAERLVFSTRSGAICQITEKAWRKIQGGQFSQLNQVAIDALVHAKVLLTYDEDELNAVTLENIAAITNYDVLYEVIQPTAWCQLDCGYCGQTHQKKKLARSNEFSLLERIDRSLAAGCYRELAIGWFGAEPLLGLAVIRSLTPKLLSVAAQRQCGYTAKIVTNGVALTPSVAAELVEKHQVTNAEVTLDGCMAEHDQKRPAKNGAPTFRRIFDNVRSVVEADVGLSLTIRCNVDQDNVDTVPGLIEALATAGLAGRIGFYTSPVYSWGNDADKNALKPEVYAMQELEWLALQVRLGFHVGLVPPRKKIVCLSVQRDAEVTDAMGLRFNCTEVPYVSTYGEPSIYAHQTDKNTWPGPALKLREFNQDLRKGEHSSCAACMMLPVCGGRCPKAWLEGTPPCPSPKFNMRERLNMVYALSREK